METKQITKLTEKAQAITVTTPEQLAEASTQRTLLKDQLKQVEEHEKKIIAPLNDAIKAARAEWKPLKDKINTAISKLNIAMSDYQTAEDKRSEEQKAKIADRMVRGTLKPETAVRKLGEVDIPDKRVGETTFVTDYVIEITNIWDVPQEYLKVELKRAEVKKAVKAGQMDIPGLIIKEIKVPRSV